MSSLQEDQLARDLRQLASGQPFTPDLALIARQARQRRRRALVVRVTTAAGAAVLAAGGLLIAVHPTGGTPAATAAGRSDAPTGTSAGRSGAASAAPRAETVAYVTRQVAAALANVNDYILRTDSTQTGPDGNTATNWTDPRTSNDYEILNDPSGGGKSIAWLRTYLVNRVLTWKDTEADYSTHTWFVSVFHAAGPISGSTAGVTSTVMTPQQIKQWFDSGHLKVVGHQEIDGHDAIGLRRPWVQGYQELWVDSQTFLPLRQITADYANSKGPLDVELVDDETWLPRTTSLLNLVNNVDIPAGFQQVPPPQ
ncbi:MAG TPA: hypothetical protein VMU95_32095 [Trebonia sp.]|nr:hypothetical protein [Trebonia sp.]